MEHWLFKVLLSLDADGSEAAAAGGAVDPNALVQHVLREAYLAATEDLRYYADKVRHHNQKKKAVRAYLQALGEFEARAGRAARHEGIDPCGRDEASRAPLAKLFDEQATSYERDAVAWVMCVPDRVPSHSVSDFAELAHEISTWEERLKNLNTTEELANVDLQNVLQKQQQTLQMMSNISKMLYDTAQSVIRKIGG